MKKQLSLISTVLMIIEAACLFAPTVFLQEIWIYDQNSYIFHGMATLKRTENVNAFGATNFGGFITILVIIFLVIGIVLCIMTFIGNQNSFNKYAKYAPYAALAVLLILSVYIPNFAINDYPDFKFEYRLGWMFYIILVLHIISSVFMFLITFNKSKNIENESYKSHFSLKRLSPSVNSHTTVAASHEALNSDLVLNELKEYKELLDLGLLTQEEFDAKKQQLLKYI